jgi:hypothetical protein
MYKADGTSLFRSEDRGATWKPVTTPFSVGVVAGLGSTVYVFQVGGLLARSDDDGLTFEPVPAFPQNVQAVQVLSDGHLLASLYDEYTMRSVDEGATWTSLQSELPLPVLEDGRGHLISSWLPSGQVVISSDEGDSWQGNQSASSPPYPSLGVDGLGRLFVAQLVPTRRLLMSVDDAATWTQAPAQLPNPNVTAFATDKAGRLLAATAGGLFRLDDPTATAADGGILDGGAAP